MIPPERPIGPPREFNMFSPIAYGPPPRPPMERYYMRCIKCSATLENYETDFLCQKCHKIEDEYQIKLNQYMRELVKYMKQLNWNANHIKRAFEEGLKEIN